MKNLHPTERTTITRLAKRGTYDLETINRILDEGLFCTIAFHHAQTTYQIPTGYVRMNNKVYVHGSVGSHYMRILAEGNTEVSVGVTLIDGLVLARSAFHHSVNYRSVVLFGKPEVMNDPNEKLESLARFTNKMVPGRWDDIRQPSESEMKKTMVLAIPVTEASAKIRTGGPNDESEDYDLNIWAGVVPVVLERKEPIADEKLKPGVGIPAYLSSAD